MSEYNRYREEDLDDVKDTDSKEEKTQDCESKENEIKEGDDKIKEEVNTEKKSKKNEKKEAKELQKLKARILELEDENAKLKNANLMVKADEINFKKRIEQEKDTLVKYGNQKLLEKLVNDLDLFDKVVNMPTDDPNLKNFLIGFEMINNNLKSTLEGEGVKKIKVTIGEPFDPKYHHVLQTEWNEEYEENAILAELKGGYMYKDRVLCTSFVKVNKKESN